MLLLCCFLHHNRYHDFRIPELEALAEIEGVSAASLWTDKHPRPPTNFDGVFIFCNLPSIDIASRILCRSIVIKLFVRVLAYGPDYFIVRQQLLDSVDTFRSYVNENVSWAFDFKIYNRSSNPEQLEEKMKFFSFLFNGNEKVKLQNPDVTVCVIEDWKRTGKENPILRAVYFGIAVSKRVSREWWEYYTLSRRTILGPTTLDNELSFLMCNQAGIKAGSVILDPYVGTGSILIAASHLKAFCIGCDIDIRVLRGYGISYVNPAISGSFHGRPDIFKNFLAYKLAVPEIFSCDNTTWAWRNTKAPNDTPKVGIQSQAYAKRIMKPWVDAIITDPPYGIRAAIKLSKKKQKSVYDELDGSTVPCITHSNLSSRLTFAGSSIRGDDSVLQNLLDLASNLLVDGGRLTFLYPSENQGVDDKFVHKSLQHKCLELLSLSVQVMSKANARMLITMKRKARSKNFAD